MSDETEGLGAKLSESLAAAAAKKEDEKKREAVDFLKELLAHNFDRASAYTNVVVAVGYAGLFGIWGLANDQLDTTARAWIALLLVISISVYVGFEIFKMIAFSLAMRGFVEVIAQLENPNPDDIVKARKKVTLDGRNIAVALFPIWQAALVIICAAAAGAAIILILNFVQNILI